MSQTNTTTERPRPRLKARYPDEIVATLTEQFGFGNRMQVPGVVKVVVNMGVGEGARDAKILESAERELALITGQKPSVAKAKKSIAAFKLREGMPVGAFCTLRGPSMFEFLERLVTVAIPRVLDVSGKLFARLRVEAVIADGPAVEPRRRAGLEAPHGEA